MLFIFVMFSTNFNLKSSSGEMLHIDPWKSRVFQLCKQSDSRTHQCKQDGSYV